jgi:hypothetical protein
LLEHVRDAFRPGVLGYSLKQKVALAILSLLLLAAGAYCRFQFFKEAAREAIREERREPGE